MKPRISDGRVRAMLQEDPYAPSSPLPTYHLVVKGIAVNLILTIDISPSLQEEPHSYNIVGRACRCLKRAVTPRESIKVLATSKEMLGPAREPEIGGDVQRFVRSLFQTEETVAPEVGRIRGLVLPGSEDRGCLKHQLVKLDHYLSPVARVLAFFDRPPRFGLS
ncbi:hypothetical protein VTI74DRAFT_1242 [Chaetomium olivicolor]